MKVILILAIMVASGLVGYSYKYSLKQRVDVLQFIREYVSYIESNLTLFKTDLNKINYSFKIMQKNKNAKYVQLILNNKFNNEEIDKIIQNPEVVSVINEFFFNLGKNEYEFEIQKLNRFVLYLDDKIEHCKMDVKNKGDLFFKLSLAIGAVLGICVW